MSDQDALLAHVLEYPDADLPRLVYADFLEESGDGARAEFIRVQCALARANFESETEKAALELRERYLREKHLSAWLAPLKVKGEALFSPRSHGLFRRGFVECVWMPARWFVTRAERLFSRCPVNELRVTLTTPEEFHDLLHSPHFSQLRSLEIADPKLGPSAVPILQEAASRGKLDQLQWLKLRAVNFNLLEISALYSLTPNSLIIDIDQAHRRSQNEATLLRLGRNHDPRTEIR